MTRLFYSILYAVTAAAACAVWTRQDENPALRDLLAVRRANAQSPDPFHPLAGDPAANAAMAGQMNGAAGFSPNYQGVANMNTMITSPQTISKPVTRPESWPGTSPIAPPAAPTPAVGADGLPGVSISSVPLIPGVGQAYNYNPKAPNAGQSPAATAGRMEFSQPAAGAISPSQAAMAATSWSMAKELEGTKILARVGTEYILAADVLGPVNEILARNADKIPPSQYDAIREQLIKQRLDGLIQTKMVMDEVRRKIPEEGFKKFSEKIAEQFDKVEVPKALEKSKLKTVKELDEDLRKTGSSLEREKRAFVERQMAMAWMHQNAKTDDEVTHQDMLDYYRKHESQYDFPARVRWEQIQVRFDRCPKAEAFSKLAQAGNRILDGAAFGDVAKSISQGPTASTGGLHDWTTKGSLVNEQVDRALFTLPPGQLSPILEDSRSFQIIRVIERKDAGRTPFTEAQGEIKKRIKNERMMEAMQKYVTDLRGKVKVWTIFDEHEADDLVPAKPKSADKQADAVAQGPAAPSGSAPPQASASSQTAQPQSPPPGYPVTASSPAYPATGSAPAPYPSTGSGYPSTGPAPAYPTTSAAQTSIPAGAPRYR